MIDVLMEFIEKDFLNTGLVPNIVNMIICLESTLFGFLVFPKIFIYFIANRIKINIPEHIHPDSNDIRFDIEYNGILEYMGIQFTSSIDNVPPEYNFKNESIIFYKNYTAHMKFLDSRSCRNTINNFQKKTIGRRAIIFFRHSKIFNLIITKDITKQIEKIRFRPNLNINNFVKQLDNPFLLC